MLDQSLVTIRSGEIINQADTDGQVLALWIHGRSKHTQRAYLAKAGRFLAFTVKPLGRVSLGDVQAFADSLTGLAQSSKAQTLAAIKSLLAFAHKIGYIPFNVGAPLHLPKAKNTLAERILQESEVHSMIALEPSLRNRVILKTLYYGGFRVSELGGLCWRDLQARGEEGQMTVFGKGEKTRAVLLPAGLWNELQELRCGANDDAPVFRSRLKGHELDQSQILRIVRAASRRAGSDKNV